jgi:hypothetical protein
MSEEAKDIVNSSEETEETSAGGGSPVSDKVLAESAQSESPRRKDGEQTVSSGQVHSFVIGRVASVDGDDFLRLIERDMINPEFVKFDEQPLDRIMTSKKTEYSKDEPLMVRWRDYVNKWNDFRSVVDREKPLVLFDLNNVLLIRSKRMEGSRVMETDYVPACAEEALLKLTTVCNVGIYSSCQRVTIDGILEKFFPKLERKKELLRFGRDVCFVDEYSRALAALEKEKNHDSLKNVEYIAYAAGVPSWNIMIVDDSYKKLRHYSRNLMMMRKLEIGKQSDLLGAIAIMYFAAQAAIEYRIQLPDAVKIAQASLMALFKDRLKQPEEKGASPE